MPRSRPSLPPDERLIELGVAYLDFARRHPGELALLFDSLSALDIDTEKGVFTPTRLFQILDDVLRDGVAEGTLRGDDEDIMVMWHGAWSLVHGMASIEAMQQHHHEDMFRGRGRDVLRAYVNGLKTDWAAGGR